MSIAPFLQKFSKANLPTVCDVAALLLEQVHAEAHSLGLTDLIKLADLLQSALVFVRTAVNSHPPINSIPNEILSHIFAHVPEYFHGVETPWIDHAPLDTRDLIPITMVCKRWRDVATSTQRLWSNIGSPYTNPATVLRWSGTSLLVCSILDTPSKLWQKLLKHHRHRIKSFNISGHSDLWQCRSLLTQHPMPALERATLSPFLFPETSRSGNDAPAGPLLFGGVAPRLRELNIYGAIHVLPVNHFGSLTRLSISFEGNQGTRINYERLVKLLSQCPQLQHLFLSFPEVHLSPNKISPPATLPYLRTLAISQVDYFEDANDLHASLILPDDTAISIDSGGCGLEIYALYDSEGPGYDIFSERARAATRVHITLSSETGDLDVLAASDTSAIFVSRIDSQCPRVYGDEGVIEPTALKWLPLAAVTELWLHVPFCDGRSCPAREARPVVRMFPNVSRLVLRIDPSDAFDDDYFLIPNCVSYLRLCMRGGDIPMAVWRGLRERARSGSRLAHLVAEIPQEACFAFTADDLQPYADMVELVSTASCQWMRVPDNFRDAPHREWPEYYEGIGRWSWHFDIPLRKMRF